MKIQNDICLPMLLIVSLVAHGGLFLSTNIEAAEQASFRAGQPKPGGDVKVKQQVLDLGGIGLLEHAMSKVELPGEMKEINFHLRIKPEELGQMPNIKFSAEGLSAIEVLWIACNRSSLEPSKGRAMIKHGPELNILIWVIR